MLVKVYYFYFCMYIHKVSSKETCRTYIYGLLKFSFWCICLKPIISLLFNYLNFILQQIGTENNLMHCLYSRLLLKKDCVALGQVDLCTSCISVQIFLSLLPKGPTGFNDSISQFRGMSMYCSYVENWGFYNNMILLILVVLSQFCKLSFSQPFVLLLYVQIFNNIEIIKFKKVPRIFVVLSDICKLSFI